MTYSPYTSSNNSQNSFYSPSPTLILFRPVLHRTLCASIFISNIFFISNSLHSIEKDISGSKIEIPWASMKFNWILQNKIRYQTTISSAYRYGSSHIFLFPLMDFISRCGKQHKISNYIHKLFSIRTAFSINH